MTNEDFLSLDFTEFEREAQSHMSGRGSLEIGVSSIYDCTIFKTSAAKQVVVTEQNIHEVQRMIEKSGVANVKIPGGKAVSLTRDPENLSKTFVLKVGYTVSKP